MSVIYLIIFAALFVLQGFTVTAFLKAETPEPCKKSLLLKQISSTIFLATAVTAMFCADNFTSFSVFMFVGFCFSWLGDFLLHVKPHNEKFFISGLFSFLVAHIFYIVAYSLGMEAMFPDSSFIGIPEMIIFVLAICAVLFSFSKLKITFGKTYLPVLFYLCTIGVMVVKAISLSLRIVKDGASFNPVFSAVVLIIGSLAFLTSDYTLSILTFKKDVEKHGWLRKLNIYTYFFGQMLLALSILSVTA